MAKVMLALRAVIVGCLEMHRHDLVTLPGALQSALVGGFYFALIVLAVNARWTIGWASVDLDVVVSPNGFDLKVRYAYDNACVGHRCYLH